MGLIQRRRERFEKYGGRKKFRAIRKNFFFLLFLRGFMRRRLKKAGIPLNDENDVIELAIKTREHLIDEMQYFPAKDVFFKNNITWQDLKNYLSDLSLLNENEPTGETVTDAELIGSPNSLLPDFDKWIIKFPKIEETDNHTQGLLTMLKMRFPTENITFAGTYTESGKERVGFFGENFGIIWFRPEGKILSFPYNAPASYAGDVISDNYFHLEPASIATAVIGSVTAIITFITQILKGNFTKESFEDLLNGLSDETGIQFSSYLSKIQNNIPLTANEMKALEDLIKKGATTFDQYGLSKEVMDRLKQMFPTLFPSNPNTPAPENENMFLSLAAIGGAIYVLKK